MSETDWKRVNEMTDEETDASDIPLLAEYFIAEAQLRMPVTEQHVRRGQA